MSNSQDRRIPKLEPQDGSEPLKGDERLHGNDSILHEGDEYPQCLFDGNDVNEVPRTSGYELNKESELVDVDEIPGEEQPLFFSRKPPVHIKNPAFREELDGNSILTRNITDESYIDTADLAERILFELKQYSIPQTLFAERILCRSQGTLSDLLRNPRPWNEMKSGKDTYRRMFNWLQQPLHIRLSILNLYDLNEPMNGSDIFSAPKRSFTEGEVHAGSELFPPPKRQRFMFTERQKSTLQAIFNETQRIPRDLQDKIADRLGLDSNTVSNFFMNARRRNKINKTKSPRRSNNGTYEEEYIDEYEDVTVDVTDLGPNA